MLIFKLKIKCQVKTNYDFIRDFNYKKIIFNQTLFPTKI